MRVRSRIASSSWWEACFRAVRAWHGHATRRPDQSAGIVLSWREAWSWQSVQALSAGAPSEEVLRHPSGDWGGLPGTQPADDYEADWRQTASDLCTWRLVRHAALVGRVQSTPRFYDVQRAERPPESSCRASCGGVLACCCVQTCVGSDVGLAGFSGCRASEGPRHADRVCQATPRRLLGARALDALRRSSENPRTTEKTGVIMCCV